MLCARDQAEEWQRLWGEERPIVAGQRPKLEDTEAIRWLLSKAIVAPTMPGWRHRVAEWNWSELEQRSPFCVCVLVLYCLFMHVHVLVCRNSADTGLSQSWDQQFPPLGVKLRESQGGVNRVDAPFLPLLCPCGSINSATAEATGKRKMLYKTLWDKGSVHLCAPWGDRTKSLKRAEKWTDWLHTVTRSLSHQLKRMP